jgi:hypothetical protein
MSKQYVFLHLLLVRAAVYEDFFHASICEKLKGIFDKWCICEGK